MNGDETIYGSESESAFDIPAPSQRNGSKAAMPDMNLANSRKIISFYQQYPEFLADPRTTHAANADFAMAAKIIGMNTTLERLNAQTKAAENKNFINLDGQKKLSEVLALDPSAVADDLLPDSEGAMPIMTGTRYKMINELHKNIVKPKEIKPKGMFIELPDGRQIPATFNPATGSYEVVKDTEAIAKEALKKSEVKRLKIKIDRLEGDMAKDQFGTQTPNIQKLIEKTRGELDAMQSNTTTNAAAVTTPSNPYKVGGLYKGGLKYLGGDWNLESSWEKVAP